MKSILAIVFALAFTGCANMPDQGAEPHANKEYVTGSAVPSRHGAAGPTAVVDRETAEREMQMRTGSVPAK
ncbi:MAG TPA: hypothetical protein VJQ49_00740 [Casimicrobiaceae bacterium]|nr:hypothetical protein [Casimicrobiaceae bacterium]